MADQKCAVCDNPATKKVIWADGRAYQPSCDEHVKAVQDRLTEKNGEWTELAGVKDLAVPSAVYPDLERKPGGPDNWVEKAGGLPSYIERIAKHLHYERGFTISHAIATAVNTVKRWARGGFVTKTGTIKRVTPKTQALAAKAVAEWTAKKGSAGFGLSATLGPMLTIVDLAQQANAIEDPEKRAIARQRVYDLAAAGVTKIPAAVPVSPKEVGLGDEDDDQKNQTDAAEGALKSWVENLDIDQQVKSEGLALLDDLVRADDDGDTDLSVDLATTSNVKWKPRKKGGFASPRGGGGKTSDGRPSYKRQGKWGHGFKPLDQAARESKAKGSPVAMKRMSRLFGGGKTAVIKAKDGGTERVNRLASALRPKIADATKTQRLKIENVANRPKVSRRSDRAWEDIADGDKVIRNGKRYVLTTYGGKNQLTEWVGPKPQQDPKKPWLRRFATVTPATLEQFTAGQLRQMLEVPGQPKAVRTKIYAMIEKKQEEARNRG